MEPRLRLRRRLIASGARHGRCADRIDGGDVFRAYCGRAVPLTSSDGTGAGNWPRACQSLPLSTTYSGPRPARRINNAS